MRLPRKIVLRGITYPVKVVDYIDPLRVQGGEKGDTVLGAFDRTGEQIEVLRSLPPQRKQIILLHEILHALTEDIELDEGDTDELAWRLYDALKRNHIRFDDV